MCVKTHVCVHEGVCAFVSWHVSLWKSVCLCVYAKERKREKEFLANLEGDKFCYNALRLEKP